MGASGFIIGLGISGGAAFRILIALDRLEDLNAEKHKRNIYRVTISILIAITCIVIFVLGMKI